MLKILFTGGGTAGHIIPNIALIQYIQSKQAVSLLYVGSKRGFEKQLIEKEGIPYCGITTGKLRRHLSWRNLLIPFQVGLAIIQSWRICGQFKPTLVFSKGGFVALPIVIAAWLRRIPIIVHESDLTAGLANRLSFPLARLICVSFNVINKRYQNKIVVTGLPIRKALMKGQAFKGRLFLGFNERKPILLIWGGSLGAASLNQSIYRLLPKLIQTFQIVHLCGPGKIENDVRKIEGYQAFDYLQVAELADVLACTDIVISRAGATAIYELLVLHKPHILVPLSSTVSRGEQIHNAKYLEKLGLSMVIYPELFTDTHIISQLNACYQQLAQLKQKLIAFNLKEGSQAIYAALLPFV